MRLFLFLILTLIPLQLLAYNELGKEENNEFGGNTVTFQDPGKGIFRGTNHFDSGGTLMRSDWFYSEEYSLSRGIRRRVADYLFEVKTKEAIHYTPKYQALRRISHQVDTFEQATGGMIKRETHFVGKGAGYSVTHFFAGKRTKLEWFYPHNKEGLSQKIIQYEDNGRTIKQVENIFTKRSQNKEGIIRSIYYDREGKKHRREWYYTTTFAKANKGAVKKLVEYNYHPSQKIPNQVNFLDAEGKRVELERHAEVGE